MPIYAYKCDACGHAKDVLQKLSDPVLRDCPACGAAQFSKQVTAAGFQLKGSGWYVTDFRGGNPAAPADKDSKAGAAAQAPSAEASGQAADGAASGAPQAASGAAAGKATAPSGGAASTASGAASASPSSSAAPASSASAAKPLASH